MESEHLLSDEQYGFRPRRSTTGQLLTCIDSWSRALQEGASVDVIYIDQANAFDKVSHPKMLHKLRSYGISGLLLEWFSVFLQDRSQIVSIGGQSSAPAPISSGILQGSVTGPLLFTIFINDLIGLVQETGASAKCFADDLKIYSTVPERIHRALQRVWEWCKDWQMEISVGKCCVLSIGDGPHSVYQLGGVVIPQVGPSGVKDLGFQITPNLSWTLHCRASAAKARSVSAFLLRSFFSHHPPSLIQAFKSYVLPLLEYGSVVINSMSSSDSEILEKEQRWFTKAVLRKNNIKCPDYTSRLKYFGLELLSDRRRRLDLIFCQKLYFAYHICPVLMFKTLPRPLKHNFRLEKDACRGRLRDMFFSNRVVNDWNTLTDEFVKCSPKTFSIRLRDFKLPSSISEGL